MSLLPEPLFSKPIFREFDNFFSDADRLFAETRSKVLNYRIRLDVSETDEAYLVEAEIPGARKEDVKVDYSKSDGILTISFVEEKAQEELGKNYLIQERSTREAKRSLTLYDIDETKIDAKFDNGLLTLTLPKKAKENHSIKIK